MAINERIQTGRKLIKLIDEDSRLWLRVSFWTKASDVEFDDSETAETKFANMASRINEIAASFQNGVNKIYNKLKGLGFTPATNSPDGICGAIQNIYDTRYTNGYNTGFNEGKRSFKPVVLTGKIYDTDTEGTNFNGSVMIPPGLDYVCAGITSTYNCSYYIYLDDDREHVYMTNTFWRYNKETGEVWFELNSNDTRYIRSRDAYLEYMIMYIPKQ